MKTVFVSGAEGFVGKRVVNQLLESGFTVVGGVRNRARKLAFEKKYGKALVCDVSDAINVARVIASVKPDAIIHLAGESLPHRASNEPLSAYQSIVTAWANILDAVRRTCPRARVVLAGSSDVYGAAGNNGQPLTEGVAPQPVSTFASMKLTAEQVAATYFRSFHLNVSIARPFQAIGSDLPVESFFGSFAEQVVNWDFGQGSNISWPDLDCRRDVLSVDDMAAGYLAILEHGQPNEVYNICSGSTMTVGEVCQQIIDASGQSVSLESLSTEDAAAITCACGNNSKLQSLGWNPTGSVESAVNELVRELQPASMASV